MSIKHSIILNYIKELSLETPDPESLIVARERISKYSLNLDISSKPYKNKMIEVFTKFIYSDKEKSKKKTLIQTSDFNMQQGSDAKGRRGAAGVFTGHCCLQTFTNQIDLFINK